MNLAAALLLMVAAVQLGPEVLPGSAKAWDYVMHGAETAALWSLVAYYFATVRRNRLGLAVAVYASAESALRPACRLMFDMSKAPDISGTLCSSAGFYMAWLCPLALSGIAWAFASSVRGK